MSKFFKVVEIIDNSRIVINYGTNDSFVDKDIIGKEIKIVEKGIEIKDPDTKEVIGKYNPIKEKLIITEAYAKFSIARKKLTEEKPTSLARAISPMLSTQTKTYYKKLNVNENENKNIDLNSKTISIGDLVEIN